MLTVAFSIFNPFSLKKEFIVVSIRYCVFFFLFSLQKRVSRFYRFRITDFVSRKITSRKRIDLYFSISKVVFSLLPNGDFISQIKLIAPHPPFVKSAQQWLPVWVLSAQPVLALLQFCSSCSDALAFRFRLWRNLTLMRDYYFHSASSQFKN